jgi:excisionase family DNA binding protein
MTTRILQFVELSDEDRKDTGRLSKIGEGDRVEVRIKRGAGPDRTLSLPPDAAALIEALLSHLLEGDRVAVLTEDQELSPNEAANILGVSRPLVVHRMEIGELPFRYVGKHRRARLKDVLGLKSRIDAQRAAMEALADDAEDLKQSYGA